MVSGENEQDFHLFDSCFPLLVLNGIDQLLGIYFSQGAKKQMEDEGFPYSILSSGPRVVSFWFPLRKNKQDPTDISLHRQELCSQTMTAGSSGRRSCRSIFFPELPPMACRASRAGLFGGGFPRGHYSDGFWGFFLKVRNGVGFPLAHHLMSDFDHGKIMRPVPGRVDMRGA